MTLKTVFVAFDIFFRPLPQNNPYFDAILVSIFSHELTTIGGWKAIQIFGPKGKVTKQTFFKFPVFPSSSSRWWWSHSHFQKVFSRVQK
jgi:hypothetical protein